MRRRKKDENKWLSLEEALKELTLWSRIDLKLDQRETQRSHIPLLETIGRVLAEDIAAPFHIPPFHNSAMDGYALDFQVIDRSSGQAIPVSQRVPAGQKPEPHKPGTAARIFTGAMMPSGTDTVIPQEDVDEVEGGIIIREEVKKGQHVRRAGEEFAKHEVIMNKGTRISPQHIGLIAEMGLLHVAVTTPPKVALIATGDELVEPGRILPPAKIYDSNSYMLRSLLLANGVTDVHSVRIADDFEETKSTIEELSESVDLMISTGGVG